MNMPVKTFDYTRVTDSIKILSDWPDDNNTAERLENCKALMACYTAFPEMMDEWDRFGDLGTGDHTQSATPVNQVRPTPVIIDEDLVVHNTDEIVFFKHVYFALQTAVVDEGRPSDSVHDDDVWKKEWVDHWASDWTGVRLTVLD